MKRIIVALIIMQSSLVIAGEEKKSLVKRFLSNFAGKKAAEKLQVIVKETLENAPKVAGDAGTEFGKNVVKSAVNEVGNQLNNGKDYIVAAGAALLATKAAPFVIAGVASVATAGVTCHLVENHREKGFRRCLNARFAEQLNDRGFPERCESPERRLYWWSPEKSAQAIEHFREQKRLTQKIAKGTSC